MRFTFYVILRTAAVLAWLFAIYALTPWGDGLDAEVSTFAMAVAVVCSIAAVTRRWSQPLSDVYYLGMEAGRRAAAQEREAGVVRLDRRRLELVAEPKSTSG